MVGYFCFVLLYVGWLCCCYFVCWVVVLLDEWYIVVCWMVVVILYSEWFLHCGVVLYCCCMLECCVFVILNAGWLCFCYFVWWVVVLLYEWKVVVRAKSDFSTRQIPSDVKKKFGLKKSFGSCINVLVCESSSPNRCKLSDGFSPRNDRRSMHRSSE